MEKYDRAIEQAYVNNVSTLYNTMMSSLAGVAEGSLEEEKIIEAYKKGLAISERAYELASSARLIAPPHPIKCPKCGDWHLKEISCN